MPRPAGLPKTGGRKPGVTNKVTRDVKEAAQESTEEAVAKLADLMRNAQSEQAQVSAIKELLDRGHGKARQALDANVTATFTELRRTLVDPKHPDS